MAIRIHLAEVMAARGVGVAELAGEIGVTPANLSILKNGHAKAIRLSTLDALCEALNCALGDILSHS